VIAVGAGADKVVGQVSRIGIRAVSVVTRDKIEFLIPNETLMTSTVENWSYSSRDVRVKVPVPVAYGSDLELAEALMIEAALAHPRVQQKPPPQVWLSSFGEKAIVFELRIWIEDPQDGISNLRSDLLKAIWRKFSAKGIQVAFDPQYAAAKAEPEAASEVPPES